MGIRYYAYAFDADKTELAVADPRRFLSDDPLADAWGMPHGAQVASPTFAQSVPETDMLYLDKAWSSLQALSTPMSRGARPRPCHRMFAGQVHMTDYGWEPCVRVVRPEDIPEIADDLADLVRSVSAEAPDDDDDWRYVFQYLSRAAEFAAQIAATRRGFVYMIG